MSGVLEQMRASALARLSDLPKGEPRPGDPDRFVTALAGRERISVIAEVKRKSPSRGDLRPDADAPAQAARYAAAGAAAVSVLTEPTRFGGQLDDLAGVVGRVQIPVLMKDFIISPEQVRVGALLGASAVLVIRRMLDDGQLGEILSAAADYGVSTLFETHDEAEVRSGIDVGARVIGVNNRDLDTLEIDTSAAPRLLAPVPNDRVVVAESGYLSPADVRPLHGSCDAVLVGSALMTHDAPERFIEEVSSWR